VGEELEEALRGGDRAEGAVGGHVVEDCQELLVQRLQPLLVQVDDAATPPAP